LAHGVRPLDTGLRRHDGIRPINLDSRLKHAGMTDINTPPKKPRSPSTWLRACPEFIEGTDGSVTAIVRSCRARRSVPRSTVWDALRFQPTTKSRPGRDRECRSYRSCAGSC